MNIVIILTASVAIVGSNSLLLSPISAAIASDFTAASAADVMLASAFYGLTTAASALFLAPVADRIGLSRSLVLALATITLALVISTTAWNVTTLCIGQALAGLGAGVALPTTYSLAVSAAPKGKESQTLGWVLTGWTLSMVAGVSLAAVVTEYFGWRLVFGFLATFSFLLAVTMLLTTKLPNKKNSQSNSSAFSALRVKGIWSALMVCAAYMIAFYGLYAFLGAHFKLSLATTTSFAGLAPLAYGIGFGIAAPFDRLIDKYGSLRASIWVFILLGAIYCLLGLGSSSALILVGLCFFWGLVNHLGLNLVVLRLTSLDETRRNAIMGLYSAVTYIGVFIGTSGFKPVFESAGFQACAFLAALCILPAIIDAKKGTGQKINSAGI